MSDSLPRINKFMADKGWCSRREADELIKKGLVLLNGEPLKDLSYRVQKGDQVSIKKQGQKDLKQKKTILLNKPLGYVSGQAEDGHPPAIRLITPDTFYGDKPPRFDKKGLAPAGRLDIDSTGLLVLTQDGTVAKKLIGENSQVEKEYVVLVKGQVDDSKVRSLCWGLELDGKKLKKAQVTWEESQKLRFVLKEGRKRQIRRMCDLVGLKVTSIRRVRIGQIRLGRLPVGSWRLLKDKESF